MLLIFPLLIACNPLPSELDDVALEARTVAEQALIDQALRAARPGPLLELADQLTTLDSSASCPQLEVLEFADDGVPTRELWAGGCLLDDGTLVEGMLTIHHMDGERWIAGDGFSMSQDGELELYLDGAIEAIEQDELLLVEAAAAWCGAPDAPCSEGPVTVDLSYSIYPASGFPDAYDVTVSGVVAPGAPISVEGSWSVDVQTCPIEPTDGAFALQQERRHDLGLDGALQCDGCARWIVQGLAVPAYCGVEL